MFLPHPLLSPYIELYLYSQMDSLEMDLIPRGNNQLFFLLNEQHTATDISTNSSYKARFFLSSPGTRHYRLICSEKLSCVGIIFKPFGAYRLLGIPQNHLVDDFTDMEIIFPSSIKELKHKMEDNIHHPEKILQILEDWLLKQLMNLSKIDVNSISFACQNICNNKGILPISELSKTMLLSKRTIENNFLQQIGISPKMYSRITRFHNSIGALQSKEDIQEICFQMNFFDQSHFIKEFKHFSGYTPTKFFNRKRDLAD